MARYVEAIQTRLAPERAFAYLADLENLAHWDPGVKASKQVAGEGPGLGSAYDVTVGAFGRPMVLRYVVTAYEPPRRLVIDARTRSLRSLDTMTFEPSGAGTTLAYDARLFLRGPLAVLSPLMALAFRRIAKRGGEGLRRALGALERA